MTCAHERSELRTKHTSTGGKLHAWQCISCGGLVGDWLPHDSPMVKGRRLPPWADTACPHRKDVQLSLLGDR